MIQGLLIAHHVCTIAFLVKTLFNAYHVHQLELFNPIQNGAYALMAYTMLISNNNVYHAILYALLV